jgi:hypothetical protein
MSTARLLGLFSLSAAAITTAAAQSPLLKEKQFVEANSGSGAMFWGIFIFILGVGTAIFFWRRSRSRNVSEQANDESRYRNIYDTKTSEEFDGDQELEWLRQAKKSARTTKKTTIKYGPKRAEAAKHAETAEQLSFDTRVFQEKMRMLQYSQLPINSFKELTPSKAFDPLPQSNDKALLNAIEQANEEFEEDEAIRELAVRVLAAFRTSNSVDALSQIALYDLSANVRSKSVTILTDFDHPSVFEAILLACADPTREVRAAAARGLFRLNFDRADAWKRLIETADEFRMSHAVRAAVEAGIVQKSLERLVHEDMKISYEAFALAALMIKAGETKEIFGAIRDHKDERVKFALLHVLKAIGDPRTEMPLADLLLANKFSADVTKRINDVIHSFERVAA